MKTQTSRAFHNAIMEVGGKDHPLMLAPILATPKSPDDEGGSQPCTNRVKETYKTVSADIHNQLDVEAEGVQTILTGIDNDIYSRVDACPNAMEMKFTSRDSESLDSYYSRFYKMMNELRFVTLVKQREELKTVSYHKLYDILKQHQSEVNEIRAERLARTANPLALKPKRAKDSAYHKEKMLLCKQEEAGIQLSAKQVDWRDDTDDEPKDPELEARYLYMANIQEVTLDATDNSRPIFDAEPLQKVQNDDDNYNVFANDRQHPESDDKLAKERDLLAFLIEKLKCKIDDIKKRDKFLESSNKAQIDKLEFEIDESKNQNKLLESSYKTLKEACKEITDVNKEMSKDIDKYQNEIEKYKNVKHVKDIENDCAKAYGLLAEHKVNSRNFLEKEVESLQSQLETQRTQFSNEIDRYSRECYYADHMNVILGVYTKLDEFTNLQCDYLDQVTKCERLEHELLKRIENVHNKSFNELSKRFSELEQHSINLKLALQQSQEQIKHDKVWKQKQSSLFQELNVKYFEIQYLKAQLQDKSIAISELKKLIAKMKGKSVETKFEKPLVIRTSNISKPKPVRGSSLSNTPFSSNSFATRRDNPVHHRLWVLKTHDGQSQVSGDADLEVVFWKSTCYIRDLKGNDLLTGSRGIDVYSITLQDINFPNPICLMAKATSSQTWL
ncbi:hypothetical protein Tco_0418533 [Tanacetum coccineum]